jgi:membrane-bound lytic murein transglycosylase B
MKHLLAFILIALITTPAFAEFQQQPLAFDGPPTARGNNPLQPYQPQPGSQPMVQTTPSPTPQAYPDPGARLAPVKTGGDISFDDWLNELRQDAIGQGIRAQTVYYALANVYPDDDIVAKDRTQPENKITAAEYWKKLLSDDRIEKGRQFYAANRELLRRVSENYGVRSQYIAALIGIESNYGDGQGKESIINALVTLAYEGRRADYFRNELITAMRIIDQDSVRVENLKGSWAGAMGMPQFMPSSYEKYAQDFDGDGTRNIWTSVPDALASAANYLHQNGWKVAEGWGQEVQVTTPISDEDVGTKVRKPMKEWRKLGIRRKNGKKLPATNDMASLVQPDGPEGRSFLVTNNFGVVMRWNRSTYFAVAVGMLADAIASR